MQLNLTYYVPYGLAAGLVVAGLYAFAAARRPRPGKPDPGWRRFCLSTGSLCLLLCAVSSWAMKNDIAFWQTQDLDYLASRSPYELFRFWAGLLLFLLLAMVAFGLAVRRLGLERVCTALVRFSFLSLIPTTFLFYDSFVATSQLVYKEVVGVVIIGLMAVFWALRTLFTGRLRILPTPYNYPVLLLWAAAGLSLAWTPSRYGSLLNFVYLSAYLAAFFMIAPELSDRRFLRLSMWSILAVTVVVALGSVSQVLQRYWGGLLPTPEPGNIRAAYGSTIGHNNAVSEVMMVGLIYIMGLAMLTRRPRRPLWLIPATLFLFVIVAATTRGIWLATPVAVVYFVRYWQTGFGRLRAPTPWGRRLKRWSFAAVLVALILGGIVVIVNHLARRPGASQAQVPLLARLQDFSPEINVRGTRARLWTIAVPMIADQVSLHRDAYGRPPFLGEGLSAFKWRYPIYQASFFRRHPHTPIWPTHLHADRMHNEYLQPIVELGVPGAIFILWFLLAHREFCKRVRTLRPNRLRRTLQITFSTVLVAGLLHCIVNFSFHVAPLAVLLIFNFAAFAALGPARVRGLRFPGARENPTLFMAGFFVAVVAVVMLWTFTGRIIYGEFYLNLGRKFRDAAVEQAQLATPEALEKAHDYAKGWKAAFDHGLKLVPNDYHLNLEMAQYYMFLFDLDRNPAQVELLLSALTHVNAGMREYQHKSVYFTRGLLLRDLSQLAQNPRFGPTPKISRKDVDYLKEQAAADAERDLRIASDIFPVEYANPVTDEDLKPLHELGWLYYAQGKEDKALAAWRRIQKQRSSYAEDYPLAEARRRETAGETYKAGVSYHIARALAPQDQDIWKGYIGLYLSQGLRDKAIELSREFMEAMPTNVQAFGQLANTARITGRPEPLFDAALAYLEREGGGHDNALEVQLFGVTLYKLQQWDLLERWLETLQRRTSEPALLLYVDNLRLAHIVNHGDWARAIGVAEDVLARRPGHEGALSVLRASVLCLALPVVTAADQAPVRERAAPR